MEGKCFFCDRPDAEGEGAFISCPSTEGGYELREVFVCLDCQQAVNEGKILFKCLSCGAYGEEEHGEFKCLDLLRSYNSEIVDSVETELLKISADRGERIGLLPARIICSCKTNPKCTGIRANFFQSLLEHEVQKREGEKKPEKDFSHMSREDLIAEIRKLKARETTFKALLAKITERQTTHHFLTWEDLEGFLSDFGVSLDLAKEIEDSYKKMYGQWMKWLWRLFPS